MAFFLHDWDFLSWFFVSWLLLLWIAFHIIWPAFSCDIWKIYMLTSKVESWVLCMFLIITVLYAVIVLYAFSKYILNFVMMSVLYRFFCLFYQCVCLTFLPYRVQKYSTYSSKSFIKCFYVLLSYKTKFLHCVLE